MNGWQVARQLKSLLEAQTWGEGGDEAVFGQVAVTSAPSRHAINLLSWPFALVQVGDATADEEEEGLWTQAYEVRLVARVEQDAWGETVLTGGGRPGGAGSSEGRGLLELEEKLFDAVAELNEASGVRLRAHAASAVAGAFDEALGYVAERTYRLEAWTTADRSYPAASRFTATDATGGDATLAWTLPPDRFDRLEVIVRRASGATAPSSVTGGTGVTLGSALPSSHTDSPGAGQWSYAVFIGYAERSATSDRYSSAATATVTVT